MTETKNGFELKKQNRFGFQPHPSETGMILRFRHLTGYINPQYMRKIYVEGSNSLLANQITSVVLFASCLLVSSIQYFGSPIQCVQDKKDEDAAINENVMNSFCFISSTYTITQDTLGYGCGTSEAAHFSRGIGPNNGNIRRHTYYIWIPFVLFFQALTFLIPYSYWRYCEGGLIGKLLSEVPGVGTDCLGPGAKKMEQISVYFAKRLDSHQFFCFAWFFYEILSFAITLGNLFLTDLLLGGWFWRYGSAMLTSAPVDSGKCGSYGGDAFPKLTKCTFYKFGYGGSLQNFDSLCVMALNVVNEKIYTILWFWFLVLAPASLVCLLVKTGVLACLKCLSKRQLKALVGQAWVRHLIGCPNVKSSTCLSLLAQRFTLSDWIFFSCFISGMSPDICDKFLSELERLLQKNAAPSENA